MNAFRLLLAWIWVTVPLSWGVYQSMNKSRPLFHGRVSPAPASSSPAPAPAPAPASAPVR